MQPEHKYRVRAAVEGGFCIPTLTHSLLPRPSHHHPLPPSFMQPEHKYRVRAAVEGGFCLTTTPAFSLAPQPAPSFQTPLTSCSPSISIGRGQQWKGATVFLPPAIIPSLFGTFLSNPPSFVQPEHKYRVRAAVEGGFSFCSDLAPTNGVGGTAPTPMDYAAAALAIPMDYAAAAVAISLTVAVRMAVEAVRMAVEAVQAVRMAVEAVRMAVEAVRMAVEAVRLAVEAVRMAVEAVRMAVEAVRMAVEAVRMKVVPCSLPRVHRHHYQDSYVPSLSFLPPFMRPFKLAQKLPLSRRITRTNFPSLSLFPFPSFSHSTQTESSGR
ncbi:unnamed protein product [Closterium sp. NIES-65]|nr:unnamed protein product [Closterium sp. NIES-65]